MNKRILAFIVLLLACCSLSAQRTISYTVKGDTIVYPFYNGLAKVRVEHVGIIDSTGKEIMPVLFFDAPLYFGENQFRPLDPHSKECVGYLVDFDETAVWFDREGKILVKEGKTVYGVSDTIPEILWNY